MSIYLMRAMNRAYWVVLTSAIATSCVARYNPPKIKQPEASDWKNKFEHPSDVPLPEEHIARGEMELRRWWQVFNDPLLNEYEEEALKNSPTIDSAIAVMLQAKAVWGQAESYSYPTIDLGASAERQRYSAAYFAPFSTSTNGGSSSLTFPPIPPNTAPTTVQLPSQPRAKPQKLVTNLTVAPTLSYEIDFWGQYYQQQQADFQTWEAAKEDIQTAMLLLSSDVANAYYTVRALDASIVVLENTVKSRQDAYDLYMTRYNAGLINEFDPLRGLIQVQLAQEDLEKSLLQRRQAEDRLAFLIGRPASDFTIAKADFHVPITHVPVQLPSIVLANRPDVRKQVNLVEAQRQNVGVAKTAFFPQVTLTADAGYLSTTLHELFKWRNRMWDVTATMLQTIFDGGYNRSVLEQAKALYQQTVADFINQILRAFSEVEDSMSACDSFVKQIDIINKEVVSAKRALDLANTRYKIGLSGYLDVIDSENTYLNAQLQQVQVQRDQILAVVDLIKSIGGSWQSPTDLATSDAVGSEGDQPSKS